MTHRRWWWVGLIGIITAGAMAGCSGGGDDNDGHPANSSCVLVGEQEPNATRLTAQFLGDLLVDDCVAVAGNLFDAIDVDSYRVVLQESLDLVVTVDHSPLVDFDIQLFEAETGRLILDCGSNVVPEICVVPFAVGSSAIAVDIVITSFVGAGTYTLTLDAQ
jgi:uncharacterized protein YdeI (BOF family)